MNESNESNKNFIGDGVYAEIDTLRAREQDLVTALDHIRYLLPLAKGYIAAHPGIKSPADIVADAEAFLSKAEG